MPSNMRTITAKGSVNTPTARETSGGNRKREDSGTTKSSEIPPYQESNKRQEKKYYVRHDAHNVQFLA